MERQRFFWEGGFRIDFVRAFLGLLLVARLPTSELLEEDEEAQSGGGVRPTLTVSLDGDHQTVGDVTVQVGSNLTLSCVIEDLDLRYEVLRVNLLQGDVVLPLVENGLVHAPFSGIARYSTQMVERPGSGVSMTIFITDIQPEDTGTYICYKYLENDNSATFNVTVLVPVTDLYITSIFPDGEEIRVEDDAEVILQEHDQYGVGCVAVVEGSLTAPSMRILIDGKDETDSFQSVQQLDYSVLQSGLTLWDTERSLAFVSTEPNPDFNEKQIRCVARQHGFSEIEATAQLFVQFSPLIRCSQERIVARIGTSATFDCNIRANPGSRITWYSARGDLSSYPNVFFDETILSSDETRLRLSVRNVKQINYQKYTLIAANIIGSSQVTFELLEDPTVLSERHQEAESVQPEGETSGPPGVLDAALSEEVQAPDGRGSVVDPDVTKPTAVVTSAAAVVQVVAVDDGPIQPPNISPWVESDDDGDDDDDAAAAADDDDGDDDDDDRNIEISHDDDDDDRQQQQQQQHLRKDHDDNHHHQQQHLRKDHDDNHHHHQQQHHHPRKDVIVGETKTEDSEDDLPKAVVVSSSSSSSSSLSEVKDSSEDVEPPFEPVRVHYSHSQSSSSSSSSKGKSNPTSSGTVQSPGLGLILPLGSLVMIARLR